MKFELFFFHSLIEECWDGEPYQRPTFRQIIERLDKISNHLAQKRCWKVWKT